SLYYACKNGNVEIIKLLIEKGDNNWNRALIGACKNGNIEIFNYIFRQADKTKININDIFIASCCNNLQLVKLIHSNFPFNFNLDKALYKACKHGKIEIINFLLTLGKIDLNCGLVGACKSGNLEIVKFLINNGADDFSSLLYHACHSKNIELIKYIININPKDLESGLIFACENNDVEMVKLLIDKDIDVEIVEYCLSIAKVNEYKEIEQLLESKLEH
ncbi:MAG: ankyrin repeat domain-containing protein, partial [Candidatus Micrarchaeaceae archaeon]